MSQSPYPIIGQPPAPVGTAPAGTPGPVTWATQTSFWQRRQPAFWLFIATLAITGVVLVGKQLAMIQVSPGAWLMTLLLLAPYVIPVALFIYVIDMYEREPKGILLAGLAWGGVAATTLALYTNSPLDELLFKLTNPTFASQWGAALTAPFVEEGFKLLGFILLVSIARPELDDILDGFVWGAMIGIGFLVVEDVFYFMNAFVDANGDFAGLWQIFLIRVIGAGPYSHFLYTGLAGMGVAYYATRPDRSWGTRMLVGGGLVALGVGCHFVWNSPLLASVADEGTFSSFLAYVTLKGLPLLIGLAIVVQLARARDTRWFNHLATNPAIAGELSPADLEELGGLIPRWRGRRAAGALKGPQGKRLRGLIQHQMIATAIAAGHASGPDDPALLGQRQTLRELRAQYDALPVPGQAAAAAPPPATAWIPTATVPPEGLPAWASPDPRAASVALAGGLQVAVVERIGDWARVVASNGWTGWVDGRRLG